MMSADGALGLPDQRLTDNHFVAAHHEAMRVFYKEIGIEIPMETTRGA